MGRAWTAVKVIAAAGICGIGVGCYFIIKDSAGNGFVDDGSGVPKLLLALTAPVLSAVVAYRNSNTNVTIRHEFASCAQGDIAMETLRRIV